jgi:hypothetical protein
MLPSKGNSVIEIKTFPVKSKEKEKKLKKDIIVSNAVQGMKQFKEVYFTEITKYIYALIEVESI